MLSSKIARGMSMIELLIGMALGVASLAAVASFVGYGIGSNAKLLGASKVNEELNIVLNLIASEVRRTGYYGNTVQMIEDPNAFPSPFSNSIVTSEYPDEPLNSCILFSYDANGNGVIDAGANNENFGFRKLGNDVQMRVNGLPCTSDDWLDLTDSNTVQISKLTFTLTQVIQSNITSTNVDISIAGSNRSDGSISRELQTQFLVKNHD